MGTTEKEINSTSWAITEIGNASYFSFFCQVIAFKMSSCCNTVIPSVIISFVIYWCWVKRWPKILVKIGDLQLAPPGTQLLSLRKYKSVLYDWLYLQLWLKCIRGLGSTSLKGSAFGLFCAAELGHCTFLVEKVLLPSSGQFWLSGAGEGSWIVLKVVAGGAIAEMSGSCLFVGAEGQNLIWRLLLWWAELCLGCALKFSRCSRHNAHQHPTCLTRLLHMKGKKQLLEGGVSTLTWTQGQPDLLSISVWGKQSHLLPNGSIHTGDQYGDVCRLFLLCM